MAKKTISFVATEDVYNRVKALFPDSIGREENLIKLLDALENPAVAVDDSLVNELTDKNVSLESNFKTLANDFKTLTDNFRTLEENFSSLEISKQEKENQVNLLNQELEKSKVLLNEALTQITSLETELDNAKQNTQNLESNLSLEKDKYYLIPKSKVIDNFMELTIQRLTDKLGKEITPAHIFTDMFLRYTIEKKARWFYPFVISDAEIKEILK